MNNLEKYGVLALIFVIVLILTVAIWNGPGDGNKKGGAPNPNPASNVAQVNPAAPANNNSNGNPLEANGENRPAIREFLKNQAAENQKLAAENTIANPAANPHTAEAVVPGGTPDASIEKSPEFTRHRIAKGDTLESIALKYLGSRKLASEILKANEGLVATKLKINSEILVPMKPKSDELAGVGKGVDAKKTPAIEAAKKKTPKTGKAAA